MNDLFTLPISPKYVSHWGVWEGIRELIQNALDQQARDPDCVVLIEHFVDIVRISTSTGRLLPETLLLGNTTKSEDPSQRGKFGEGYKLALLVLTRAGHPVTIHNGDVKWRPEIEFNEQFNSDVLNVHVEDYEDGEEPVTGVDIHIHGITEEQWRLVELNRYGDGSFDEILHEPEQKGRVYVGGLFVSHNQTLKCGYAFRPGTVMLDRDRGMVDGFDLEYQTSRLWTRQGPNRRVDALLDEEAPDVKYVEAHVHAKHEFATGYAARFVERHGPDVTPVATQEEVEQANAAGMRWVLVPKLVKALLSKVRRIFIPSFDPPVVRLEKFLKRFQNHVGPDGKRELEEIIALLKPVVAKPSA
jgi:hypothetical protein